MPPAPRTARTAAPARATPERLALRARLVADDRATTALAAQQRLEAICVSLARQLQNHDVEPYLLVTLSRARPDSGSQPREVATAHGTVWPLGGFYLSPDRPHLLDGGAGYPSTATATAEGLEVTRYATTLMSPWQGRVPDGLGHDPVQAIVLGERPGPVRVRGVLHRLLDGDVERDAVGAGTWYVRDADTTITLHDTGDDLILRDLEHDLVRDVVAASAWWNR